MYRPRDLAMNVPYRRTAQVRIRWSTGDEDGREENGTPGEDGKIKATPPSVGLLWSINGLRRSAGKGRVALFRKIQSNQRELRHPWGFRVPAPGAADRRSGQSCFNLITPCR